MTSDSFLRKKRKYHDELNLLRPVPQELLDSLNRVVPETADRAREVFCFDVDYASPAGRKERLAIVAFCDDGVCYILDKDYVDRLPHKLKLSKAGVAAARQPLRKPTARGRERTERLFIHFIEAINGKIQDNAPGGGPFLALGDPWRIPDYQPQNGEEMKAFEARVKEFRAHVEMFAWSDPKIPCDRSYEVEISPFIWLEDVRSVKPLALYDGTWSGNISQRLWTEDKELLTERFCAACWSLGRTCDISEPGGTEWEYEDGDGSRRGGYGLQHLGVDRLLDEDYEKLVAITFLVRVPSRAQRTAARSRFARWLKRLVSLEKDDNQDSVQLSMIRDPRWRKEEAMLVASLFMYKVPAILREG